MEKEIIESMLSLHLSDFSDINISNEIKPLKVSKDTLEKDIYLQPKIRCNDITVQSKEVVKLLLAHKFIKNNKTTYFYGTGKDIFDIYMSDGVEGQVYIQNVDTLVLCIGNDFKNSYMQEILPSLLLSRKSQNILIWENKIITDSSKRTKVIKEKYGEELYEYITSECSMLECDKKSIKIKQ